MIQYLLTVFVCVALTFYVESWFKKHNLVNKNNPKPFSVFSLFLILCPYINTIFAFLIIISCVVINVEEEEMVNGFKQLDMYKQK